MNSGKTASMLGLCRKAGKLVTGFDAVAQSMERKEASLIVKTCDVSAKTGKEITFLADRQKIPVCTAPVTMDELWTILGRRVGIMAITDAGLAGAVSSELSRRNEEEEGL